MDITDTSIDALYAMDWLKNAEFKDGIWHYSVTEQEKVLVGRVMNRLLKFINAEMDGLMKWKERLDKAEHKIFGCRTIFRDQCEKEFEDLEGLWCAYDEVNEYFEAKLVKTESGYSFQSKEPMIEKIDHMKAMKTAFDTRSKRDLEKTKKIQHALDVAQAKDALRRSRRKSSWFDDSIIGGMVGAMGGEVLYDLFSD